MLWRRPDRIHQRTDNADRVIELRRVFNSVARCVIGVPRLRLKRQENGHPLLRGQKLQHEATILPNAVIAEEGRHVALVHVDIMNAEPGQKVEDLIPRLRLGAPALAKSKNLGDGFLNRPLDEMLELIAQIIVGTGQRVRQRSHVQPIEEISADIVQAKSAGGARQRREAFRQLWKTPRERMLEIVVYQEQQL